MNIVTWKTYEIHKSIASNRRNNNQKHIAAVNILKKILILDAKNT